jgi:hypothetical protein
MPTFVRELRIGCVMGEYLAFCCLEEHASGYLLTGV